MGQRAAFDARGVKRLLSGRGVVREDSDDELGDQDLTWEWIYAKSTEGKLGRIEGAKYGGFQCMLGDCVLLKAESAKEAWVALVCEFLENEHGDEKEANFMWFSTEKEIRNKDKKRKDALKNELYITPSFDVNPLVSINGSAKVMSLATFNAQYRSGALSVKSKDRGKVFVCRRGCNTRTATYTEEFIWENVYKGVKDIDSLIERVRAQTKLTRRRRQDVQGSEPVEMATYIDWPDLQTPKKKQTLDLVAPRTKSAERAEKFATPTHKRIVIKKALEFTPLGSRILSSNYINSSPFQIARTRLHVSSIPLTLPCREEAFATVYSYLESAITDGVGTCIYISGTPGTGKTATVREIVAQLNAAVQADELDDFIFVEINGMKVTDPHQSYSLLWEALQGERVSPSHALDLLEQEFTSPSPRRVPCVVLMDELDQLVTKNQSVMYNFFNWPGLHHSRLIVLAVANTMDLPERTLSNKISSRIGLTRITFPGYTHEQLMKIIQSRLEGVPGNIIDSDAIQFASRKVAAVSGDARRVLDICRRAVEIAESEVEEEELLGATPSKRAKSRHPASDAHKSSHGRVVIATIKEAINEATSSPLQRCIKALPLASKLFLAGLLIRVRRSGIAECALGDIIDEAKRLIHIADEPALHETLLTCGDWWVDASAGVKRSQAFSSSRATALGRATVELVECGIVALEPRRGERTGKIRLIVNEEEIKLALRDDLEVRGLGFS